MGDPEKRKLVCDLLLSFVSHRKTTADVPARCARGEIAAKVALEQRPNERATGVMYQGGVHADWLRRSGA
jgi:hypothetical protein